MWQCICILTTWCVSLCSSWHNVLAMTFEHRVIKCWHCYSVCLCESLCVNCHNVWLYIPMYVTHLYLRYNAVTCASIMIKLSQCVLPRRRCYKACLSQLLSALTCLRCQNVSTCCCVEASQRVIPWVCTLCLCVSEHVWGTTIPVCYHVWGVSSNVSDNLLHSMGSKVRG